MWFCLEPAKGYKLSPNDSNHSPLREAISVHGWLVHRVYIHLECSNRYFSFPTENKQAIKKV